MTITIFVFSILSIPLVIFINVILFHILIKSAIKRLIKPVLENNKLTFVDYKWVGFWGCGDFKSDNMEFALFKTGLNTLSIYSFLYYKNLDVIKKITVKIYVEGLKVSKVEFSSKI